MSYSRDELMTALRNAHNAGDTEAARRIAQMIQSQPQQKQPFAGIHTGRLRAVKGMWDAARGNATEDAPNASGLLNFRSAMSTMFGDDEDYAAALKKQYPDAEFKADENGNPMVGVGGQDYYINKPGLDGEDLVRLGGKILSFVPAGRLAGVTKGLFGRAGIGAAGGAATDAAMQKLAGREEVDRGQMATVGAFGGAAELAAPVIARTAAMMRGPQAEAVAKGREIARAAGRGDIPDDLAEKVGRRALSADEAIDPQKLLAEEDFGFRYSRGMLTERPRHLNQEEALRQSEGGETVFRQFDQANTEAQKEYVDQFAQRLGANPGDSPLDAAGRVRDKLSDARQQLEQQVGDAYGRVGVAAVQKDALNSLSGRLRAALSSEGRILDDALTPAASRAINDVSERVAQLPDEVTAVTIKAIENQRKRISNLYGAASNQADRAALQIVKREFDNWMDEAVDSALFSGDPEALSALKNARAVRAKYGDLFQGKDSAGKMVQKLLAEERTPEEVAQFVVGLSDRVSPAAAAKVVKKIKEAAPEAADDLRQAMFLKIAKGFGGQDAKGRGTLVSTLRQSLSGKGRTVMNELFSPDELNEISRFAQAMDWLLLKGDRGRSSGTTERIMRQAFARLSGVPGLGQIMEGLNYAGARSATTSLPQRAPQSIPGVPAALETYAQGY